MIKKTVVFILSILVLLIIIDKAYEYLLNKNNNIKSSYISNTNLHAEALVLGPCEPLWSMQPKFLEQHTGLKFYNLATNHSNFAENYAHLYLYLQNNNAPKYVFLYVTTESTDGRFNVFNTYRLMHFNKNNKIKNIICDMDSNLNFKIHIPLYRYSYYNQYHLFNTIQGVKHFFTQDTIPYFFDGYIEPKRAKWDFRFEQLIAENPHGINYNWHKKEAKYLRKILELCADKNIKCIMYESPIYKPFVKYMNNRDDIKKQITQLAKKHHTEYWVFDTLQMAKNKENFFSLFNTTPQGTKEFLTVFCKTINKKLLIKD